MSDNRNYSRNYSRDRSDYRDSGKKKVHSLLPPPHVLQAYEDLAEGSVEKLVEMAEIEQAHRHKWEDQALRSYSLSTRIGQLFGLCAVLAIAYVTLKLSELGEHHNAKMMIIYGFSAIAISSIVSFMLSKVPHKPKKFVPYKNRNPRANDESED